MAQHLKCNTILEGTTLLNNKLLALATAFTLSTGAFVATSTEATTHTVKTGEPPWSIAQQIDKLKNNNPVESHVVLPSDQLKISSNEQENNIYVVQPGDSLYVISKEYGLTVDQLVELNGINASDLIYPGDTIALDEEAAALKQASTQTEMATQLSTEDDALTLTMTATAYTAYCEGCSGITKNGTDIRANPHLKVIAVDPNVIPLGTRVWVEGYGEAIAADIGGAIKGNIIDVFIPSHEEALQWGRKTVKVRILE